MNNLTSDNLVNDIAIIGMSGRFPRASNIDEFWFNIREGKDCISFFSEKDLQSSGVGPALISNPNYVKAKGILDDIELFDALFFGFNPREAETIDPQHRMFLECAWEALEDSGYNSQNYDGLIGVYAGASFSSYLMNNVLPRTMVGASELDFYQSIIGNDKDHISTRVSYKLDLRGPSVTIQTACSTSLVNIAFACQSLLSYQCDIALAGGASIMVPQKIGYLYQEGMISCPDGRCRAFDAKAQGTVRGEGVGVVILKRLTDALSDGDQIRAVIKGSAVNNDGSLKVGYTAPGVDGQSEVIFTAQAMAGIEAETISYVEAHGTGTPLGDPIEIAALTKAFRASTDKKRFCAIGSVKTNIGHLDAAAGVAGLIKTVLALENKQLPPSLHFETPNPKIDFDNSPFYVNTALSEWTAVDGHRRAGVSSFGMGGTNAHVIVEEAPDREASSPSRPCQLLVLSAKTETALKTATEKLAHHLKNATDLNLADAAYTLQVGRRRFGNRRMVVCQNIDDAVLALDRVDPKQVHTAVDESNNRSVIFMFSGQGSQYVNMASELYRVEPTFRETVDRCSETLKLQLGCNLRDIIYADGQLAEEAERRLAQTSITQPALFVIEFAMAKLLAEWGIRPQAMIGHSIGEYVAACLAGVFTLEEALKLVALRGRLIQELPHGSMLAIALSEKEVLPLLGTDLSLAAVNGPLSCVVSGPDDAITILQGELNAKSIGCNRLHTSHAFHSKMMEPILPLFTEYIQKVNLRPPNIRYVSNVTGTWITDAEATDPLYWVRHLRQTVRFTDGIAKLLAMPDTILLEVGPGQVLATLSRRHPDKTNQVVLASLHHPKEQLSDVAFLLNTLGRLWLAGATIDWEGFYKNERRYRISLPTYPFERQRYWVEPVGQPNSAKSSALKFWNKEEPTLEHTRPHVSVTYMAPRNKLEEDIAGIWRKLLGFKQLGVFDNFLELGGDSLSALRVVSRMKETYNIEVSLDTFFENPSVSALAVVVDNARRLQQSLKDSSNESGLLENHMPSPLEPVSREGMLPVSFSQERLWFLHQLEPESAAYNIPGGLRFTGRLRIDILEQSLSEIVRRHEALRTIFKEVDGKPMQVISAAAGFNLALVDLGDVSEAERREKAQGIATEEARRLFDLSTGPLFRAVLVRLGEQEHLLYFTMHHIITDGWSFGVFWRELGSLYEAFSAEQASPLAELPIQYADYAVWQREWLQGEVLEAQVEYWKKQLGAELPVLQLPTDRPRPAVQTHHGANQVFELPEGLAEKLKTLSQRQGATLFMTLLAGFKALLYRYTGQVDFAVGSPIANRTRTELEGLVGFFVNTLILRTDLSGDPRFVELLGKVRETAMGAFAHQDTPFEKLVEVLNPARDMSYSPLFQVMFAFQNMPRTLVELPGLSMRMEPVDGGSSMFDLTFYMWERGKGLSGIIEYNTDLFEAATIERMVLHFETLLAGVVVNPAQRLSELPLLAEGERHQLLAGWNATAKEYPRNKTLVQLFEEQVERSPEAAAVVYEGAQLTYRDLNARANQLAHYLQARGVGREGLVGIWMERSLELMVALVGTLKAGGAYVPLDPNYPRERLAFMLDNAQAPVLLTRERFIKDLPEYAGRVVCMDRDGEAISRGSEENIASLIGPSDAVYVIYTSGSTGTPKGVIGLHRGAVNRLNWMWRAYPFKGGEVCCQKTYLSFVDSVWEIFGPLLKGVPTLIIGDDAVKDPHQLVENLAANHVSRIVLVPSLLRVLLDSFGDLQKRLPELRLWVTSGEEIPVELAKQFLQAMPEAQLINLYGSSEVSADVTCYEIGGDLQEQRVPIGRPIDNTQVHLLDEHLQPVPIGVHGEIYVGGAGLAGGYLNLPDLTAERFIASPFRPGQEEVLFKTGDLGRRLADGRIEYLGRRDNQVKIRGFRVELGEVESKIKELEAVSSCMVVLREDRPGDQRLVAYYVRREGETVSGSDVRRHLQAKLPDYMVPQHFVRLESIPLTPNGKVDRRALPKPEMGTSSDKEYVAPRTDIERTISEVWKEVLEIEKVGIHDNFFDLGGHSLLMVKVLSKVQNLLGKKISMIALFQYPSIGALCRYLCNGENMKSTAEQIHDRAKQQIKAMIWQKDIMKVRGRSNG